MFEYHALVDWPGVDDPLNPWTDGPYLDLNEGREKVAWHIQNLRLHCKRLRDLTPAVTWERRRLVRWEPFDG